MRPANNNCPPEWSRLAGKTSAILAIFSYLPPRYTVVDKRWLADKLTLDLVHRDTGFRVSWMAINGTEFRSYDLTVPERADRCRKMFSLPYVSLRWFAKSTEA